MSRKTRRDATARPADVETIQTWGRSPARPLSCSLERELLINMSESTSANAAAGVDAAAAPQLPPSRFQPASLGLRADFRLTDFSKLKG